VRPSSAIVSWNRDPGRHEVKKVGWVVGGVNVMGRGKGTQPIHSWILLLNCLGAVSVALITVLLNFV